MAWASQGNPAAKILGEHSIRSRLWRQSPLPEASTDRPDFITSIVDSLTLVVRDFFRPFTEANSICVQLLNQLIHRENQYQITSYQEESLPNIKRSWDRK